MQENDLQLQPAVMVGQASVIRAKVQVTKAQTGKVEEWDLIFTPIPNEQPKEPK
jgi:hypothetical protein